MSEFPDNSIVQLGVGVFLLVVGLIGQWIFDKATMPPGIAPEAAALNIRRNKMFYSAFWGAVGFAICNLLHFAHAARLAGIHW